MAKKKTKKRANKAKVEGPSSRNITRAEASQPAVGWWDDHIARLIRMFFAGALGAAILNLIVWILSLGLFNINPMVVPPGATAAQQLNPMAVLLASVVPALGAAIVYFFMDKAMGERTWRIFLIVAVVLGLLSLFSVWALPVGTGSKIVLTIMHAVSVAGILWGIRYTLGYFPEAINRWVTVTG